MPLFKKVESIDVPENIAVCPECGRPLFVDNFDGVQLVISCKVTRGHKYQPSDWQLVRAALQDWAKLNVVAY